MLDDPRRVAADPHRFCLTAVASVYPRRVLEPSMLDRFKGFWQGVVLLPFVSLFIRLGISPDAVTLVGTIGVCAGALVFFPQGELLIGVLVITAFVFSDLIDGKMARELGPGLEVRRVLGLHPRPVRRRRRSSAAWRSTSPAPVTATSTCASRSTAW